MIQFLRRYGSVRHEGGGFKCPRCHGTKIKFVEQIGNVDLYQCHTILTPLLSPRPRPCMQKFFYQTKEADLMPAEDLKKRPALAFAPTASEGEKFIPRMSASLIRKLASLNKPTNKETA